ncbi:MAG: hypothetical protein SFZ23_09495 [Planctomycetota bacterium]|nr:hypothetical protein [Planctomycetota bacterium]
MSVPAVPLPLQKFLGVRTLEAGPFSVLGLDPLMTQDADVLSALQARLGVVSAHPLSQTPEADEVRLALHAAAAQLLNRGVRERLVARLLAQDSTPETRCAPAPAPSPARPAPASPTAAPIASGSHPPARTPEQDNQTPPQIVRAAPPSPGVASPRVGNPHAAIPNEAIPNASAPARGAPAGGDLKIDPVSSQLVTELERDILMTVSMSGGWNASALRRATMIAHTRGAGSRELGVALARLVRRGRVSLNPTPTTTPPPTPAPTRAATPASNVTSASASAVQASSVPGVPALANQSPSPRPTPVSPSAGQTPAQTPTQVLDRSRAVFQEQIDPGPRRLKLALLIGGGCIAVLGAGLLLVAQWTSSRNRLASTPPDTTSPLTTLPEPPKPIFQPLPKASTPPAAPLPERGAAEEIRSAVAALEDDPALGVSIFTRTVQDFASRWCQVEAGERQATLDAIIEFVHRAAPLPEVARQAVDTLAAPSAWLHENETPQAAEALEALWPSAFSLGVLTRLTREPDLPLGVTSLIAREMDRLPALGRRGGGSFALGASAAAHRGTERLALLLERAGPDEAPRVADTWRRWVALADAVHGADSLERHRLVLGTLELILQSGPDPAQSRATFEVVRLLVQACGLHDSASGSANLARTRVLRWFDAPAIAPADLFAVTKAIADHDTTGLIDTSMVASATASDVQRKQLRQRYARVWNMVDVASIDAGFKDWLEKAAQDLQQASPSSTPISGGARLARVVRFSRLSHAATLLWIGDPNAAASALASRGMGLDVPEDADPPPADAEAFASVEAGDGEFTLAYFRVVAVGERLRLIDELTLRSSLGPVDARTLVSEALRASQPQVGRHAMDAIRRLAGQPAIVNAVLELAPTLPRSARARDLVETVTISRLPPPSDPEFRHQARRALVERLLASLATTGPLARVDELTRELVISYEGRASAGFATSALSAPSPAVVPASSTTPAPTTPAPTTSPTSTVPSPAPSDAETSDADPPSGAPDEQPPAGILSGAALESDSLSKQALAASGQVRAWWARAARNVVLTSAESLSPAQVQRRAVARAQLARNSVQAFLVDQLAVLELMGGVLIAEDPSRAAAVRETLDDVTRERRRAASVLEQIESAERGMVRLWILRLQGGQA